MQATQQSENRKLQNKWKTTVSGEFQLELNNSRHAIII